MCTAVEVVILPKSLKTIEYYAFEDGEFNNVTFYYCGSEEEFALINIGFANGSLTEGNIVYNYSLESEN